jgi:hypothetical protein
MLILSISLLVASNVQSALAATPAPIISLPTSTLSAPAQVAIAGVTGSITYVTLTGATPTSASPIYTGPITIYDTTTVKAISILGGVSSTVSSVTLTLNATHYPPPSSTDSTVLKINLQLPTTGISQ